MSPGFNLETGPCSEKKRNSLKHDTKAPVVKTFRIIQVNNKCMHTHKNLPSSEYEKNMALVMDVVVHAETHSVGRLRNGVFFFFQLTLI